MALNIILLHLTTFNVLLLANSCLKFKISPQNNPLTKEAYGHYIFQPHSLKVVVPTHANLDILKIISLFNHLPSYTFSSPTYLFLRETEHGSQRCSNSPRIPQHHWYFKHLHHNTYLYSEFH